MSVDVYTQVVSDSLRQAIGFCERLLSAFQVALSEK